MKIKQLSHLLILLALCFNCLNASTETLTETLPETSTKISPKGKKIEKQLLTQIDGERLAYQLYTELFETYPEIKIFKNIIAAKKQHFSTLVDYAKANHPDLKTGQLKGRFLLVATGKLYDEWLKKGKTSIDNAIEVGIELEKMDIEEVTDFLNLKPKPELAVILEKLKKGSRKHLAAFKRLKTRI